MASIFDSYDNPAKAEQPEFDKPFCPPPQPPAKPLKPFKPNKPYEEYNAEGQLVGFWWNYGNSVNLEFELSGYVTIEEADTYVPVREFIKDKNIQITLYNFRHEEITTRFYSGSDYQTITYSEAHNVNKRTIGVYYTHRTETDPETGEVISVYEPVDLPEDYEEGVTYYKQDDIEVIFGIDEDFSKKLLKGVYFCSVAIVSADFMATVFFQEDCTLQVK